MRIHLLSGRRGVGVAPVLGLWNSADKVASVTLSNGNLDATNPATANWCPVRGVTGKSTGKLYFECNHVTVGGQTNPNVGVADAGHALVDGDYIGAFANSFGISATANFLNGFTLVGSGGLGAWTSGGIAGFAVDLDVHSIWVAFNNVWLSSGNPAAGINPFATWTGVRTLYPAVGLYFITTADVVRLLANTSNQTYAPPSGFAAWNGA